MAVIRFTREDIERWEVESQEPAGEIVEATVSDIGICEGEGCHNGFADIHAHVTCRWENGAVRREHIPMNTEQQRDWLLRHRRDLYQDWLSGKGWAHGEL